MSSFDRSSSEEEFFDACSGEEKSYEESDSLVISVEDNQQSQLNQPSTNDTEIFNQPKAPPRKKKLKKDNSFNRSDQKDIHHLKINNLTSYVDDIESIQGDLSVTDAYVGSDRKSVHVDDLKRKDISDDLINRVVEENRLKEIQQLVIKTSKENTKELFKSTSIEDKSDVNKDKNVIKETIKEDDEQSVSSNSNCINPINLHLLKITNDYDSEDEHSSQVTEKVSDNLESLQEDQLSKKEQLKNKVKSLKKIGQGLIKGVQKVKNSTSVNQRTELNQTNLEKKAYQYPNEPQQDLLAQQQNQFKFKSNRKKEPPDFEGLKIIQELNDCKGAIWCMKWSVCGKLLAVAGKGKFFFELN